MLLPQDVRPEDLRFSYAQADEPIVEPYTTMAGNHAEVILTGTLLIEWDSPMGTFALMRAMTGPPHPETLEELRPMYAMDMADAYAKARA